MTDVEPALVFRNVINAYVGGPLHKAVQVDRDNIREVARWVGSSSVTWPIQENVSLGGMLEPWFTVPTIFDMRRITVGHWVIKFNDYIEAYSPLDFKKSFLTVEAS